MKNGIYKRWLDTGAKPVFSASFASRCLMAFRDTDVPYDTSVLDYRLSANSAETASLRAEYLTPRGYCDDDGVFSTTPALHTTIDGVEQNGCYVPINQASMAAVNGWTWTQYAAAAAAPVFDSEVFGVSSLTAMGAYKDSSSLMKAIPGACVIVLMSGDGSSPTRWVVPMAKLRKLGALDSFIKSINKLTNHGPGGQMSAASWPSLQDAYTANAMVMRVSVWGGWWEFNVTTVFDVATRWSTSTTANTVIGITSVAERAVIMPNFYGYDELGRACDKGCVGIPTSFSVLATASGLGINFSGSSLKTYYTTVMTQNSRALTAADNQALAAFADMRRFSLAYTVGKYNGPTDVWGSHIWTKDYSSQDDFLSTRLSDSTSKTYRDAKALIAADTQRRVFSTNCQVTQGDAVGYSYTSPNLLRFYYAKAPTNDISMSEALGARSRGAGVAASSSRGTLDSDTTITSDQRSALQARLDTFNTTTGLSSSLGFLADGLCGLVTYAVPKAELWASCACTAEMKQMTDGFISMFLTQMTPYSAGDLTAKGLVENGIQVGTASTRFV